MNDSSTHNWPEINFSDIEPTLKTLHQWLQIVGKIKLKAMPWQNHSWHTTFAVTSNGFTTGAIPYQNINFEIVFDFQKHLLNFHCSNNKVHEIVLEPMTVSQFYHKVMKALEDLHLDIKIYAVPNEIEPPTPFVNNHTDKYYDKQSATKIWKAMLLTNNVFQEFRSNFIGKCSPVHLFWGAFDLAVTRFSGKNAPTYTGEVPNIPLDVMQEAYSKEVSSAGFWLGSEQFPFPIFYAYIYPTLPAYALEEAQPQEAFYDENMGEFILKYDDILKSEDPKKVLLHFLNSTYEAGAKTLNWDRENLEKKT